MTVSAMVVFTAADPADNDSLTIRPAAGQEVLIQHLEWGTGGGDPTGNEVYRVTPGGTDLIMNGGWYPDLDAPQGVYPFPEQGMWCNNAHYLTLKNVSGGARTFHSAYGVETHVAD